MEMKGRKCKEITSSNVTSYTTKKRAPRILQETNISSKASKNFLLPKRTCQMAPKTMRENGEKGGRDGRNLGIVELH
jgi:hypothetical protein